MLVFVPHPSTSLRAGSTALDCSSNLTQGSPTPANQNRACWGPRTALGSIISPSGLGPLFSVSQCLRGEDKLLQKTCPSFRGDAPSFPRFLRKGWDSGELTLVCHQRTVEVERVFFLSFQIL